jgi:hypothetical protein
MQCVMRSVKPDVRAAEASRAAAQNAVSLEGARVKALLSRNAGTAAKLQQMQDSTLKVSAEPCLSANRCSCTKQLHGIS